jgi:hypothetical protein
MPTRRPRPQRPSEPTPHHPLSLFRLAPLVMSLMALAPTAAAAKDYSADGFARRVIYHSPQKPGYTCWTGCWRMPDGSLMTCFTQATGPVDGRPSAPSDVQTRLSWPPPGHPRYDMTGLDLRNVHLRSTDGGATWNPVSADSFRSPMNGVTGECETALPDGTVIRGVWGHYLPYDTHLPRTGFLQRSLDGTRTWGTPEIPLDPAVYTAWPKRLRVLKDGRLILLGGLARVPADSRTRADYARILEPWLQVSADGGKSWSSPIDVVPQADRRSWGGEEYDVAELPGGNLLCVFRRLDPKASGREVRWQGVLKKQARTWVPTTVAPAPFPHSGHPELLATREGPVLHLATSGIHCTDDEGASWHKLDLPGTNYYPRSLQAPDGRILVFAHVGSDDAYGTVDQAITMDAFSLK